MDVRHYFDSVDFSGFRESDPFNWKHSLGEIIEKNTTTLSIHNLKKLDVAIIGAPFDSRKETNTSDAPDNIRAELYQLAGLNHKINIADFGNLKPASSLKGNYQALRDIVDYFSELKIVTIIIGGSQDLTTGMCEAFQHYPYFCLTTVDSHLNIKRGKEIFNSSNYLTRIFNYHPQIFQFNLLGYQSHFVANELLAKAKGINQHVRLGILREDIAVTEPILRNTDVLSFDIGAIKYAEAPGNGNCSPNGLNSEEACQLAKYAGISARLKVFGLFEVESDLGKSNITVQLSAQIIWYFLEGFVYRTSESIQTDKNITKYQVEVSSIDKPLVFLKNSLTNQWWMAIESLTSEMKYFGCSEKDYEQAANNEIPELWIKYIQKMDEILK